MTEDVEHITDHDLERYYLGMVIDESELATIEKHLLWCQQCLDRMESTERYVNAMRAGIVRGAFEVELLAGEFQPRVRGDL